jgi:hypothetical protein
MEPRRSIVLPCRLDLRRLSGGFMHLSPQPFFENPLYFKALGQKGGVPAFLASALSSLLHPNQEPLYGLPTFFLTF